jgi:hypothetical protein
MAASPANHAPDDERRDRDVRNRNQAPPAAAEAAETPADAEAPDTESTRLEILRALERGDITVAEATDRLSQLDEVLR